MGAIKESVRNRLKRSWGYFLDQLGQPGTWQGIGFAVSLIYGKQYGGLPWGEAAALGGAVSAIIKIVFPDSFKK